MALYKRGGVWWYEFVFDGVRIRQSTKTSNKKKAQLAESRARMRAAGLVPPEPPAEKPKENQLPTLADFAGDFRQHIKLRRSEHPEPVRFYNNKLSRLLEYSPLANARLDRIDEQLIEKYVSQRVGKGRSPATVNRELATLRRLLYFAKDRRKLIGSVPKFEMLDGERSREFVLSREDEKLYLEFATGHLKDAALLILDTGMRIGEVAALLWEDVHLEPVGAAKFGYLQVRSGKSKNARRTIPLTSRVSEMLRPRLRIGPRVLPVSANTLEHHHQDLRDKLGFDSDFVLHSLRHTMLTRLGESGADAFTIKRLAGHHSTTVSERYVHPTPEHVERTWEKFEAYGVPTKIPTVSNAEIQPVPVSTVQ